MSCSCKRPDDRSNKHIQTAVLKILQELKEDVEKVKKIMYEQNGHAVSKKRQDNLKRN